MSAAGGVRVEAARVIADVLDGRSLKAVLAPREQRLADARDRGLLHAIVLAAVRGAFRWRAILSKLLDKPLPQRAGAVEAALMSAFAQVEVLGLPEHAVVDETVAAVRRLRLPAFAGLANAVLRRWLREREAIAVALADDPQVACGLPPWWLARLQADWPDDWPHIVEAGNAAAPMWLRVNATRIDTAGYGALLAREGIGFDTFDALPQALRLREPVPVTHLPGFGEGLVTVQDGGAQFAAHLLAPRAGERVLDACAAPGGKTGHLLELCPSMRELVALDVDPARVAKVGDNLRRLGHRATLRAGDAVRPETWWDGIPFQRILLDAPCSATGILRRQPDVRLHRRASDIDVLKGKQLALLDALWPLLAPGGRLLYVVCSVLREESDGVLAPFLAAHADARVEPVTIDGARSLATGGVQLLPGEHDMDGFAYVCLARA
jgi:16S rRNA (cytosine967-C5)-methyltransferase